MATLSSQDQKFEKAVPRRPSHKRNSLKDPSTARHLRQSSTGAYKNENIGNGSLTHRSTMLPAETTHSTAAHNNHSLFSGNKTKTLLDTSQNSLSDPFNPIALLTTTDQRSFRETITMSTTGYTDRASTPTTINTNRPKSSKQGSYYLPLTTRRDLDPGIIQNVPSNVSFGNNPQRSTTPQQRTPTASSARDTAQNTARSHSPISTARGAMSTKRQSIFVGGDFSVCKTEPAPLIKSGRNTKEDLELMRRERELRRIVNEFGLPEWNFPADLPIEQREEIAKHLITRQVSENLRIHEERHAARVHERKSAEKVYQVQHQTTADPRANFFSKIDVATKYPALKGRLIDHIIDTDQLKKSRDEILRRKFRSRKAAISQTPAPDSVPGVEFDAKKGSLETNEKYIGFSDLRFKKQFDEWLDDELGRRIIDKIQFLSKYHSINFSFRIKKKFRKDVISSSFSEGTRFDPILPDEDDEEVIAKKLMKNNEDNNGLNPRLSRMRSKIRSFSFLMVNPLKKRDPELNKWLIYLSRFKSSTYYPDGTMQHVTRHPSEYADEYWDFFRRRRELQEANQQYKKRDAKKLFKIMFAKIRAAQSFTKHNKLYQSQMKIKRRREAQPETLKDIRDAKREAFQKYQSMYSQLRWDEQVEKRYRAARGLAKHFLPVGSLGCANAVTTFEFFKYEDSIKKAVDKINEKDYEEKKNFYFINSNPYNRRRMQEEIDLVDKSVLKKFELEVANQVLSEYEQNKIQLYNRRKRYLEEQTGKKKQEQKEKSAESKRKERLEIERKEHLKFSKQIRELLDRIEKKKTGQEIDKDFANSEFYNRIRGHYSKATNLAKISDKIQEQRELENAMTRQVTLDERDLIVPDPIERNNRPKSRLKMQRVYSGGPRLHVSKASGKFISKEEKIRAVIKLQARVRGMLARIRYRKELDNKRMTEIFSKKYKLF